MLKKCKIVKKGPKKVTFFFHNKIKIKISKSKKLIKNKNFENLKFIKKFIRGFV